MSASVTALFKPPTRLRPIPDSPARLLRPLWILCFGLAVLTVVVSTMYAVRASYAMAPVITEHGLETHVTPDGELFVRTLPTAAARPAVTVGSKVLAFNGRPVSGDLVVDDLADLLGKSKKTQPILTLRQPDGRQVLVSLRPTKVERSAADEQNRNLRIWTRLGAALLACTALLACSLLLALRRPNDPVAMLLAFAFVGMAASIDPALQFWLWTNKALMVDLLGGIFFYLLLVALAAFPDGVFVPRLLRWLIPLGVPLAVFVSVPGIDEDLQGIVGISLLLAVLLSQIVRFRRQGAGIARQQIKWAGFGFASGLLLIFAAMIMAAAMGDDPSTYTPFRSLLILVLFSTGMAVKAIGLLVALVRFRLWEADTVITRSAAYAVVTLIVGVVWAASSDLVKLVITEVIGRDSEAGATTVGAIIAAGIFAPTQSAVLGWTRKRFGGPMDRIEGAAQRLKSWGLTETPAEVATRALSIIEEAVHPAQAAVLLNLPEGTELVAARNVESKDDRRLLERLTLADEAGPVGELRLGRRSDGNRYNRQELEAVRQLVPHLADALRVARGRHSREAMLQHQIESMAARLAQLEGGTPKPA